jgi:hypothetical protein
MTAETIASALSGHQASNGWWRLDCPVCHNEQIGLRDAPNGLHVSCYRCTRAEIISELRRLGLDVTSKPANPTPLTAEEAQRQREAEDADRHRRIALARDIWEQTEEATDTIVAKYLGGRRILLDIPYVIRLHWSLWHKESGERRPAMIARVDNSIDGASVAVHATYLAMDGSAKASLKPARKSFGPIAGAAIQLGQPQPDKWHVIGEGIETVMSVMQCTGFSGWAAVSAGNLERLPLPPTAQRLMIAADNDDKGRGQLSARRAARRWLTEGRAVKIAMPPVPGSDWNDVLMGQAPALVGSLVL